MKIDWSRTAQERGERKLQTRQVWLQYRTTHLSCESCGHWRVKRTRKEPGRIAAGLLMKGEDSSIKRRKKPKLKIQNMLRFSFFLHTKLSVFILLFQKSSFSLHDLLYFSEKVVYLCTWYLYLLPHVCTYGFSQCEIKPCPDLYCTSSVMDDDSMQSVTPSPSLTKQLILPIQLFSPSPELSHHGHQLSGLQYTPPSSHYLPGPRYSASSYGGN